MRQALSFGCRTELHTRESWNCFDSIAAIWFSEFWNLRRAQCQEGLEAVTPEFAPVLGIYAIRTGEVGDGGGDFVRFCTKGVSSNLKKDQIKEDRKGVSISASRGL